METIDLHQEILEYVPAHWTEEYDTLLAKLRWLMHTPYAHCKLVVQHYDDVLAAGGCLNFGATGWISLMRSRDDAAWEQLAKALIAQLEADGTQTQSVLSTVADVAKWEALGFVQVNEILRYSGGKFLQATRDEVIHYETWHNMAILHMDKRVFGEDRSTMLLEHTYLGQVYEDGKVITGYSLMLLGEGVIVCDDPAAGLEMQRWHFPLQDHILIPAGNDYAHAHLTERGYTTTVEGIRMVRGPVPELKVEKIFGWG
jgi:hypothetical protein